MPFIRSLASIYYTLLAISISLNSEIMSPCSHYIKKGLVCVAITALFSCQSFSYFKCTKANTRSLYNIHLVFINKYMFRFSYKVKIFSNI